MDSWAIGRRRPRLALSYPDQKGSLLPPLSQRPAASEEQVVQPADDGLEKEQGSEDLVAGQGSGLADLSSWKKSRNKTLAIQGSTETSHPGIVVLARN